MASGAEMYFALATAPEIRASQGMGSNIVYATMPEMGLSAGDVIDALSLLDVAPRMLVTAGDRALFSLRAGSPSLEQAYSPSEIP